MKLFIPAFKKLKRTALFVAAATSLAFLPVSATSYQESIDEAQGEYDSASDNKDEAETILEQIQEKLATLESEAKVLDVQIADLQAQITAKEEEAEEINEKIEETKIALADAEAAEEVQYASMSNRIQYLYENGEVEYLDTLMSSSSFTDMINKSEYIEQLSAYDQEQMDVLIGIREEIEAYEKSLKADLREVEAIQAELEEQKVELESISDEKTALIAKYEADEVIQEALISKYQSEMEEAEALIAKYQAEAAAAAEALIAEDGTVYYNVSGTYVWPAPSSSTISSGFGPRVAPTVGASTYHRGIDIPVVTGSDIIASASGTVMIAQYSASAGYYIMIDHGNGVSTAYMHNSQLLVTVGETVTQGQVIAKSGNTGVSTGPHCHFALIINGTYVDPTLYLTR